MNVQLPCNFVHDSELRWNAPLVTVSNSVTWYGERVHDVIQRLIQYAVDAWQRVLNAPSTRFELLPSLDPWVRNIENDNADIVVRSEYMDGPGGTLAYVPLPVSGDEVGVCDLCGNVFMDQWERWTNRMFYSVFLHEFGHALGFGHSQNPDSIMKAFYSGQTWLGQSDIELVRATYDLAA